MLKKFLYDLDEKNRKIISFVVEDTSDTLQEETSHQLIDQSKYQEEENDIITANGGELVYVVFNDNEQKKYLDVKVIGSTVRIGLTDNISYAACLGKEMANVILYNYDYFGLEDCQLVFSGFYKNQKQVLQDKFDNFFRKASDSSYCQIRKDEEVYFLAINEEKNYYLTPDFNNAVKVHKNDVRKILTVYGIIDKNTNKKDLSFSKYNCFTDEISYLFAAEQPLRVKFEELYLTIDNLDTGIKSSDKIINNEVVFNKMKDLFFKLGKENTNELYYLKYNKHFVKKDLTGFLLVSNPANANLLDSKDIEIFKSAISIFQEEGEFIKYNKDALFIYYTSDNTFKIMNESNIDFDSGLMIEQKMHERFQQVFLGFSNSNIEGSIVIKDKKYLQLNIVDGYTFELSWLDSAYNASVLTEDQISCLVSIFKWDIQKRIINNLIKNGNLNPYNIVKSEKEQDIFLDYENILDNIVTAKHRICSYDSMNSIKQESAKGSLEYLRRFYVKDIYDSSKLFVNTLRRYDFINNILIVGQGSLLNLIGLNKAVKQLDKKVKVSTLDSSKVGYSPLILLSKNVDYVASYRFEFSNLVSTLVDSYDMIVFTKGFNEEKENFYPMLKLIINNPKNMILANMNSCNIEKKEDPFYDFFKNSIEVKRKFFNHNEEELEKCIVTNDNALEQLRSNMCRCFKPVCDVCKPVIANKYSYHCIIRKKANKIKDHYKE